MHQQLMTEHALVQSRWHSKRPQQFSRLNTHSTWTARHSIYEPSSEHNFSQVLKLFVLQGAEAAVAS